VQLLLFFGIFIYFVIQPAIISPDTHSYLHAGVYRYPGYVGFLNGMKHLFGEFYETAAVAGHLLFSFVAIRVIHQNLSKLFDLKPWARWILFGIFLLPFFPPLSIANNLTSEGISYPLYLLMISYATDFLFKDQLKKGIAFSGIFLALALTRGQFVVVIPILTFLYLVKYKRSTLKRSRFLLFLFVLSLPLVSNVLDKSYRKVKHDFFVTTPFSYSNAIALPLYVSEKEQEQLMEQEAHTIIFRRAHAKIKKDSLLSSMVEGDIRAQYQVFHDNFPKICNQSMHKYAKDYY